MATYTTIRQGLTVNSVPVQVDTSLRLNIRKRRERIVYRTITDKDNINIAYLLGTQTTPSNNLFIVDRSNSLVQNRIPSNDYTVVTAGGLLINTDKVLITDTFTTDLPTAPKTPLFYVHTLKNFNSDIDNFADKILLTVEFANYVQKTIAFKEYVLDTDTGKIYNNIENIYDVLTGELSIKFIKYAVKTTTDGITTIETYHELVDNQPVYEEASWDDIDEYGNIVSGRQKFISSSYASGAYYEIKLPSVQEYAYKEIPASRIRVLTPTAADTSLPWNVRVSNGSFLASLKNTTSTYLTYSYKVAEFASQLYNPYPPYKQQNKQTAIWIHKNLIKAPRNVVYESTLALYTTIVIKDSSGTIYQVLTNDPDKIDTYYASTSILHEDGILSIDRMNGFIEVAAEIASSDIVEVYYFTEEDEYLFSAVDFNPVTNSDILKERIVIYTVPETTYTGELDTTLHYLKVNQAGQIIYCSQVDDNPLSIETSTTKLRNEDFNTDGSPKHEFYYDTASTASGLAYRASGINTDAIADLSFIDKYTVESVLFYAQSGIAATYPTSENLRENPHFLVLADITVGESEAPARLADFDVRVEGGGLKEEYVTAAMLEQPEVLHFTDIETPKFYPSAGSFYVQVPQSLLTINGGDWTKDQIRSVVDKHMRAGGYAAIDTYGLNPVITSTVSGIASVRVDWPSYGNNIAYNAYFSNDMEYDFVLASGSPFADNTSGNSLTLEGLSAPTTYFVYIESVEPDGETSMSQTVSITTRLEGSS